MEFDTLTTGGIFAALIVVGIGGLAASSVMPLDVTLMMVLPSTVVFGLICLAIGVKHGEFRAGGSGGLGN